MNIQKFPIEQLTPYQRNAKTHPKEQVDKIAKQISEVGFLVPIVVDKDHVVIAGHGRLLAAKSLNMQEVPVVVADHLTEDQVMAWRIADNKVAESPFDMQLLAFDLQTLELHGVDLTMSGISMDEAKAIVASLSGPEIAPEKPPSAPAPGSTKLQHQCPQCGFEFNSAGL